MPDDKISSGEPAWPGPDSRLSSAFLCVERGRQGCLDFRMFEGSRSGILDGAGSSSKRPFIDRAPLGLGSWIQARHSWK